MTDKVHMDRDALAALTQRMQVIADELDDVYTDASAVCSGDGSGPAKRRYGVRVALGTHGYEQLTTDVGERLAMRVSEGLTLAHELSTGVRELGAVVTEIQRALDAEDNITAAELRSIVDEKFGTEDGRTDYLV